MNRFRCLFSLLVCLLLTVTAHAQAAPAPEMTHVALGPSSVPLYGPWKFRVGDSPVDPVTNAPLWAAPGFADSKWETVDLTPQGSRSAGGICRLRERLDSGRACRLLGLRLVPHAGAGGGPAGREVALAGPSYVDDAYQLPHDLHCRPAGFVDGDDSSGVLGSSPPGMAGTLANAGHLPPYLNGHPIDVEGALPLGVINDAEFSIARFQLQENDRLVLASDGIVEAMNEQGQLFGFARVQELVQTRLTAAELATQAQSFGQQDDISVIGGDANGESGACLTKCPPADLFAAVTIAVSSPSMKSIAPRRVESRQNSRIKELRAGLARGVKSPHIAIEGWHLTEEAVKSGLRLHTVFVREGNEGLLEQLATGDAEVLIVTEEVFQSATLTEHPQGIAALVEAPEFTVEAMLNGIPLVLIAAGLQDPGNLGTLVRSAEAFGASGMILLPGTVSLWNAKTLRASSGSAFRLPVVTLTAEEAFATLRAHGVRIFAAVARDGGSEANLRGPSALLVGNEGSGLPDAWIAQADARVTIPLPGAVESLNAAIAGSVLLYDAMRQRKIDA